MVASTKSGVYPRQCRGNVWYMLAGIDKSVSALAVIVVVKAFHFSLIRRAELQNLVQYQQDDQRTDSGVRDGNEYRGCLHTKLLHGSPAATSGDGCVGHPAIADKEGETNSTYNTADTVDTEYIQGVVISELVLENYREVAEARGENAKEQ